MGRLTAQKDPDSDSDITLMMLPPPAHNLVNRATSSSAAPVDSTGTDEGTVPDVVIQQQPPASQSKQLPSNNMDTVMPDLELNPVVQLSTPFQVLSESIDHHDSETIADWLQEISMSSIKENKTSSLQATLDGVPAESPSNPIIHETNTPSPVVNQTQTGSMLTPKATVNEAEYTVDEHDTNIEGNDIDIELQGNDEEFDQKSIDEDKDEYIEKGKCMSNEADDEEFEAEKRYLEFSDTTVEREPPIDITSSTRKILNHYQIPLDPPEQTSPPLNLLEAVEAELRANPICFQWQQFDTLIPRVGNFRMTTRSDLASSQLPHFFHQCFQFEKNQKETSPVKMTSQKAWEEELLKLFAQEAVFLMEWSGEDPNAGSEYEIEAGSGASGEGNYSGLILAACIVQEQGWDPTTEKAVANFTNHEYNTEDIGGSFGNNQPFDMITLRGEFGYDEQRGLGDNPLGVRTRFQNLADAGGQPLGSGSGIFLRKTKIGAVKTATDGNRRGINVVQSNSHLPVITAFCINPKFFGHNFGTVLLNLVTETLAAVGYRSIIGPVQHAGLDLYLTFVWTDYQRLVLADENGDYQDDDSSVALGERGYEPTELLVRGQRLYI